MSEILISDKYWNWIELNSTFLRWFFSFHFHSKHFIIMLEGNADCSMVDSEWWSLNGQRYYSYPIQHSPLKFLSTYSAFTMYTSKIHCAQCIVYCHVFIYFPCQWNGQWIARCPITIIRSMSQNRFHPHIRSSQFVYSVYWSDISNATPNHINVMLKNNQFNWIEFKRFVVVFVSTRFFWFKCH